MKFFICLPFFTLKLVHGRLAFTAHLLSYLTIIANFFLTHRSFSTTFMFSPVASSAKFFNTMVIDTIVLSAIIAKVFFPNVSSYAIRQRENYFSRQIIEKLAFFGRFFSPPRFASPILAPSRSLFLLTFRYLLHRSLQELGGLS